MTITKQWLRWIGLFLMAIALEQSVPIWWAFVFIIGLVTWSEGTE